MKFGKNKRKGSFSIEAALVALVLSGMGLAFYTGMNGETQTLTKSLMTKFVQTAHIGQ